MTMRLKERELVAVGISVASGCKPCTDYHVGAVRKARATDDEIRAAMAVAMRIRRDAADVMEAHGLAHLGDKGPAIGRGGAGGTSRIGELVAIGAAFAVNCATHLERHMAAARMVGVDDTEIQAVAELARFIKGKAASHVERPVEADEPAKEEVGERPAAGCGCG